LISLKKKALLLFTFVLLFSITGSIAVTTAQDTLYPLVALSSDQLTFYGKEGNDTAKSTITVVGLAKKKVDVTLSSATFYQNDSANSIKFNATPIYVDQNETTKDLFVNVKGAEAGTYKGAIIATAEAPEENMTSMRISVTVKIESDDTIPSLINGLIAGFLIVMFVVPWTVGVYFLDSWGEDKKRVLLTIFGILVSGSFIFAIITKIFGDLTLISTVLIVPFLAYVVYFIKDQREQSQEEKKDQREERQEQIKTAVGLRSKGLEKDLDFLKDILGELAKHYASLTSKHYSEKGLLPTKKWDDQSTQGIIMDLDAGRLAKYYGYAPIHDEYYKIAMKIPEKPTNPEHKKFIKEFNALRTTYAKLEESAFAYLSYQMGLLGKTYLEPLDIEYPRLSRKFIEYLTANKLLTNLECGYNDQNLFEDQVKALNAGLFKKVALIICKPEKKSVILAKITENFDNTYEKLEKTKLPSAPADLVDTTKEQKLKVEGALDINMKTQGHP
jgi:Ca2+/Na+ antiporter